MPSLLYPSLLYHPGYTVSADLRCIDVSNIDVLDCSSGAGPWAQDQERRLGREATLRRQSPLFSAGREILRRLSRH